MSERPLVLVVDDDPLIRDAIEFLLGEEFEVELARHGVEAVGSIRKRTPDVVLLDMVMPRMNGVETLRRIREHWPELKVIGMSGAARGERSGAGPRPQPQPQPDQMLYKPFSGDRLNTVVRTAIGME